MALVEAALRRTGGLKRARIITESLATTTNLVKAAAARYIPVSEPFAGLEVGPLTVVGPTPEYYGELVAQFGDADAIRSSEHLVTAAPTHAQAGLLLEALAIATESLDDNPQTQPENNSSAILGMSHPSGIHLLTGDAGAQALACAAEAYNLRTRRSRIEALKAIPEPTAKEWVSVAYLEAIAAQAGLNSKRPRWDSGIDIEVGSDKPTFGSTTRTRQCTHSTTFSDTRQPGCPVRRRTIATYRNPQRHSRISADLDRRGL